MTSYRDPEMGSTKPLAHLPLFDEQVSRRQYTVEDRQGGRQAGAGAGFDSPETLEEASSVKTAAQAVAGIHATARQDTQRLSHELTKPTRPSLRSEQELPQNIAGIAGDGNRVSSAGTAPMPVEIGQTRARLGDSVEARIIHATSRSTDPDTSKEAAESFTEQRLTEIQGAVLELFRIRGRLTDEEIEDALFARYPAFSTLRKRRTNLVQMGLIRDSGERKWNRNMRRMIVWEIVK